MQSILEPTNRAGRRRTAKREKTTMVKGKPHVYRNYYKSGRPITADFKQVFTEVKRKSRAGVEYSHYVSHIVEN